MLDLVQHRSAMFHLLQKIFTSNIWYRLAFKWGTLAYFYHGLDRFSTDLDIDVMDGLFDDNLINEFERVLWLFWKMKIWYENAFWRLYKIRYDDRYYSIKVDLNARIWKSNRYELVTLQWIDMYVMEPTTMFANKLFACSNRMISRDIWDIYFFAKKLFQINEAVILERIWIYELDTNYWVTTAKQFYAYLASKIETEIDWASIVDSNLWEVLTQKQKHRARANLKHEVVNYLHLYSTTFPWDTP